MTEKFQIRAKGYNFYFNVHVYDKIHIMRRYALNYSRRTGNGEDVADIHGIVHPYTKLKVGPKGGKTTERHSLDIGIIRLTKTHLSTFVVAHEVMHAAMHLYRTKNKKRVNADFGGENSDNEESFANIYASLFRDMTIKLYDHKLWPNARNERW